MKLYKLFPLIFLFVIFLNNSEAICCDAGCSPFSNVCCTPPEGGPSEGFVGCYNGLTDQYECPNTALGECLTCGNCDPITTSCEWVENLPETGLCNSCDITTNDEELPINSVCSSLCPSGTTKCQDGTCQENCNEGPSCTSAKDNCCLPDSDGICDPDCTAEQDQDCGGIDPYHAECTPDLQCVQISGAGQDLCGPGNECEVVSGSHKTCGASGNCVDVQGPGQDTCINDVQCIQTNPTHAECSNSQCVEISGAGQDLCADASECGPTGETHKACGASGNCVDVEGPGNDLCSNDLQCTTSSTHSECTPQGQCIVVSGQGQDLCNDSTDCTSPPPGEHDVCSPLQSCVTVAGPGNDLCSNNAQCISPITCTPNSNDCCVPLSDEQCDMDCVDGLDPDCGNGNPDDDGICNAETDGICDVNCVQGVDPDCDGVICTPNPSDCCSLTIGDECDPDCPVGADPDCNVGPGYGECTNDGVCTEFENCLCNDCITDPSGTCLPGLFCCNGLGTGNAVCSGDQDNDLICDYNDFCIFTYDESEDENKQEDTDFDCFINNERTPLFGQCGDQCDFQDRCFDEYGSRQCCDDFAGTNGDGTFYGFTSDCSLIDVNSVGCWTSCIQIDGNNNVISYQVSQCIDGTRLVTKLQNGITIDSFEEACTSIPLIPFYTNFSIAMTLLVLVGYYVRRKT